MSAIDSDIDYERESNPKDMLKTRESVRNAMLNKFNTKKWYSFSLIFAYY